MFPDAQQVDDLQTLAYETPKLQFNQQAVDAYISDIQPHLPHEKVALDIEKLIEKTQIIHMETFVSALEAAFEKFILDDPFNGECFYVFLSCDKTDSKYLCVLFLYRQLLQQPKCLGFADIEFFSKRYQSNILFIDDMCYVGFSMLSLMDSIFCENTHVNIAYVTAYVSNSAHTNLLKKVEQYLPETKDSFCIKRYNYNLLDEVEVPAYLVGPEEVSSSCAVIFDHTIANEQCTFSHLYVGGFNSVVKKYTGSWLNQIPQKSIFRHIYSILEQHHPSTFSSRVRKVNEMN